MALIVENARVTNCNFDFLVHLHDEGHSPARGPPERGGVAFSEFSAFMAATKLLPRVLTAGMRGSNLLGPLRAENSEKVTPLQRGPPTREWQPSWTLQA